MIDLTISYISDHNTASGYCVYIGKETRNIVTQEKIDF